MTKLPLDHKGFTIADSNKRGGKAGRGRNKTASIQVREACPVGYLLKAKFRYTIGVNVERETAINKARLLIDGLNGS